MKWQGSLFALIAATAPALAQGWTPISSVSPGTSPPSGQTNQTLLVAAAAEEMTPKAPVSQNPDPACQQPNQTSIDLGLDYTNQSGRLKGDREFGNFIGFMSNATLAVDPRALTQIVPIFANNWNGGSRFIPSGSTQVYGPLLSVALTERLAVGFTDGGYAVSDVRKTRQGWLNLGGFAQYTLIRDVEDQFIFTGGLQWRAPSGSSDVFQGTPPANLAPYLTFGKEFCEYYHVLGTAGYMFPAGSGRLTTNTFYANLHFDRQVCGWLYPLVEFNGAYNTRDVDFTRGEMNPGFFDLDRHNADGSLVTVAPGFNAVIVKDKVEFGAVYETPIYSQHNLKFNEVLVKLVLRY
jgi:hypothetical protein